MTIDAAMLAWQPLLTSALAAAAALAGLLFVGLSMNLARISAGKGLPDRALLALLLLIGIMLVAAVALIPGVPAGTTGVEVVAAGLGLWAYGTWLDVRDLARGQYDTAAKMLFNAAFFQLCVLPYVAGGIALALADPVAIPLISWAMIFSFLKATIDAWVLLVEINR